MAVLIANISVVINLEAVRRIVPGGTGTLAGWVPNGRLSSDGEVASVRFAWRAAARRFVDRLVEAGLDDRDVAIVDPEGGPGESRDWLSLRHVPHEPGFLPVAMRRGSLLRLVVVPPRLDLDRVVVAAPSADPLDGPVQFTVGPDDV